MEEPERVPGAEQVGAEDRAAPRQRVTAGVVLRSLAFNLFLYVFTALMCLIWTPALAGPRRWTVRGQRLWAEGVLKALPLAGIRVELRGRHHLPPGAALVAAKHQSMWDTIVLHAFFADPAIVLKRELLKIPLYGWFARKARMIAVDRQAGARTLKRLILEAQAARDQGRPIVIFPEGTRVAPGASLPYKPGVAALYTRLGLPCVPVALNSGLFWPRRRFLRWPGVIVFEFLPPIPPGLDRQDFAARLRAAIEPATERLLAEAAAEEPQIAASRDMRAVP